MNFYYKIITSFLFLALFVAKNGISQEDTFLKGADGSVLSRIEDDGGKYFDNNVEKDAITIFGGHGFNYWRLKIWHTPDENYNNLADVLKMAKRIKDENLNFLLDFHYSDTWADPGHQTKPQAWSGLPFNMLKDSVYTYTKKVITALYQQNTPPDMVQIGNEISCGMLWNDGNVCGQYDTPAQWEKLAQLINEAIRGVNDGAGNNQTLIMIHFNDGGDNSACRWFFDNLLDENVDFDIIGLSFYPWWLGTLTDLKNNLNDLSVRYNKDLVVVEGAYPWTLEWKDWTHNLVGTADQLLPGYSATVAGQKKYLTDLMNIIKEVPGSRGIGFFYWSPEALPWFAGGSPWENLSLFDFDGNVLESITAFEDHSSIGEINFQMPFFLEKPFPNPTKEEVTIGFSMKKDGQIELAVSDLYGRKIEILVNEMTNIGQYSIHWNPGTLANGLYLVSLESKGNIQTQLFIVNQ